MVPLLSKEGSQARLETGLSISPCFSHFSVVRILMIPSKEVPL